MSERRSIPRKVEQFLSEPVKHGYGEIVSGFARASTRDVTEVADEIASTEKSTPYDEVVDGPLREELIGLLERAYEHFGNKHIQEVTCHYGVHANGNGGKIHSIALHHPAYKKPQFIVVSNEKANAVADEIRKKYAERRKTS